MGTLVEKQDETINDIETVAQSVEMDMEKGFVHLFTTPQWFLHLNYSVEHTQKAVIHGMYLDVIFTELY